MIELETMANLYINTNYDNMRGVRLIETDDINNNYAEHIKRHELVTKHNAECYAFEVLQEALNQVGYDNHTSRKMQEALDDFLLKHPSVKEYYEKRKGPVYD
jgi:hypothetical protein